jgi:vancomycin resistance protein YoaR
MSKFLYSLFFIAICLALPGKSQGAVLTYNDKVFEIEIKTAETVKAPLVRNDFDLKLRSMSALAGKSYIKKERLFSPETVVQIEQATSSINQLPRSAVLVVENGKAMEFEPEKLGQAVDIYLLKSVITAPLKEKIKMPVHVSYPEKRLADTNTLGINELIAVGESNFAGSSYNRKTNIRVGSTRFNGIILAPGEEFSFNKHLGEINAANGYLPEIVIKRDGLRAEFGGGLCQVSSTAFRAAVNGGLKVTERRNHSFAVSYYAPQGTDATIYPGVVDLKFINDTPAHMLIWTRMEGNRLFYEYYGTKDSRIIELDDPIQYDKRASGAMKAVWKVRVIKNNETVEQVFNSTYVSPALFQQQSTVQASTPNPDAPNPDAPEEPG